MLSRSLWTMGGDKRDAVIWDALVHLSDGPQLAPVGPKECSLMIRGRFT